MTAADNLLRLGLSGERARRAAETLGEKGSALVIALKRTLPYLARRKVDITIEKPRAALLQDVIEELAKPFHVAPFGTTRGNGALVLDAMAIGTCMDGILGGDGTSAPVISGERLSHAQAALADRIARELVTAFADVLAQLGMRSPEAASKKSDPGTDSALTSCVLEIGGAGRIALLLPQGAVELLSDAPPRPTAPDARMLAAMGTVPVEVAAELGRMKMSLRALSHLKVGDVLRLPLPVSANARVRVGACVLWQGKPSAIGGRMVVEIDRHGD